MLVNDNDSKGHYVSVFRDLDKTIGNMSVGMVSYSLIISLIHNDAGITYTATASAVSSASIMVTLFFGEHAYGLSEEVEFPTEKITAPLTHNVKGLPPHVEELLEWAVSKV